MTTSTNPIAIAYMPHSGITHLVDTSGLPDSSHLFGVMGTLTPLCAREVMHGAMRLEYVPSCYQRCLDCDKVVAASKPEPDDDVLGPCGCTDYHMNDCPTRTGGTSIDLLDDPWGQDLYYECDRD